MGGWSCEVEEENPWNSGKRLHAVSIWGEVSEAVLVTVCMAHGKLSASSVNPPGLERNPLTALSAVGWLVGADGPAPPPRGAPPLGFISSPAFPACPQHPPSALSLTCWLPQPWPVLEPLGAGETLPGGGDWSVCTCCPGRTCLCPGSGRAVRSMGRVWETHIASVHHFG